MGDETGVARSIAEFSEICMKCENPKDEEECVDCGHKRYNHNPSCKICNCEGFKEVDR